MKKQTKYLISGGVFAFVFALTLFLSNNLIGDTYAATESSECPAGYHRTREGCSPDLNSGNTGTVEPTKESTTCPSGYHMSHHECVRNLDNTKTSGDSSDKTGNNDDTYYYTPTCTSSYLEYGCSGSNVKTLQTKLNAVQGCGLDVDGGFGAKTEACVYSFQKSFNLAYDGVAGSETFGKLNTLYNSLKITLNNASATTAGTAAIYEKYNRGYYLDSAGSNKITTSSNKITVPKKAYTVTYNYNDSTTSDSTKTASYTFGGYYTSSGGSGTQYITSSGYLTSSASNKHFTSAGTLYAKWTGASISLVNVTREGYTFNGWYTKASGGTKVGASGASYSPTSNITLYAHYTKVLAEGEEDTETHTPDDASILGDVDVSGAVNEEDYNKLSDYLDKTVTLTDSEKANADLNSDGKIDVIDKIILRKYLDGVTGFTTLPVTNTLHKITFVLNYDDEKIVDVVFNDGTINRPTVSRNGYKLENWYSDEDLTTAFDFSSKITSDTTLYAKWVEREDYVLPDRSTKDGGSSSVVKDKTDDEITTNSKTGSAFIIATIVLAIVSLGLCGYFLYKQKNIQENK